MSEQETVLVTEDGHRLQGVLFQPDAAAERAAAVVIHPATAVDLNLYRALGRHLAEAGWPALVYDYRGCGRSAAPGDERREDLRMSDWMLQDVPAATRWMRQRFPGRPVLAVGHSVGGHGQAAAFREEPVEALAMVASHAGVTRTVRTLRERLRVWAFFNLLAPVSARLLGRVPVREVRMGKPLPLGAVLQWARWTRHPDYFFHDPELDLAARFAEVSCPVLSVVVQDDLWATREASEILLERMPAASVQRRDLDPEDFGLGRAQGGRGVGHMGFFRSAHAALWPVLTDWLESQERRLQGGGPGED